MTDMEKTERLTRGDDCEFRYPARSEWRKGWVVSNGGSSYWSVLDLATSKICHAIYIEHVRAVGTDPWGA